MIGLLLAASLSLPARAACPDCNIVLIGLDTLNPEHLGCYGYLRPTSPSLDALARRGTIFDRFIVQAYLTPISMASILTSEYPSTSGFTSFSAELGTGTPTLPEIMRLYGYETAAAWTSPEFYKETPLAGARAQSLPKTAFARGFDYVVHPSTAAKFRDVPGQPILDWIAAHRGKRFFVWIGLGTTHWPYGTSVPEPLRRRFVPGDYAGPLVDWVSGLGHSAVYGGCYYPVPVGFAAAASTAPARLPLTQSDRGFLAGRYDASVAYSDEFVGRLTRQLERQGLARRTVVVAFSVHSEELDDRGDYGHYDIRNSDLRGALIVSHPALRGAPARAAQLVTGLDIAPTVLEIAGIPVPKRFQGVSLAPILEGSTAPVRDLAFSERIPIYESLLFEQRLRPGFDPGDRFIRYLTPVFRKVDPSLEDTAVQDSRWKLIHRMARKTLSRASLAGFISGTNPTYPEYELYDLESDPKETKNVADSSPAQARRLKEALRSFESPAGRKKLGRPPAQVIPYP